MHLKEIVLNEKIKPISKGYPLYDPIYITFLKCQNYRDRKQIIGQELEMRGEGREVDVIIKEQHERDLCDDGIILYLVVGGCYMKIHIHCTFKWRRKWQLTPVILAWKIPCTGEPGGLQSMGSQRVRYN